LRIISSKDLPMGAPDGSNRQPHSEQPKPRKRFCSSHTSFRLTAASVAAPQRVPAYCQETKRSGSPLTASFAAPYCLIAAEDSHSTCASLDGLSGILQTWKIVVSGTPDFGASFEVEVTQVSVQV
jgi:hypothetical protein